jgi:hypothetical protein
MSNKTKIIDLKRNFNDINESFFTDGIYDICYNKFPLYTIYRKGNYIEVSKNKEIVNALEAYCEKEFILHQKLAEYNFTFAMKDFLNKVKINFEKLLQRIKLYILIL